MRGGRLLGIGGGSFSIQRKCYRKALGRASSIPWPLFLKLRPPRSTPRSGPELEFYLKINTRLAKDGLPENFFELNSPHTVSW